MGRFEVRVRRIEEKVEDAASDSSLDASTVEKACEEGKVALAAKLMEEHLKPQWAKYGDDEDGIVQVVLRDKVLRELSLETLHQLADYCRNELKKKQPNL